MDQLAPTSRLTGAKVSIFDDSAYFSPAVSLPLSVATPRASVRFKTMANRFTPLLIALTVLVAWLSAPAPSRAETAQLTYELGLRPNHVWRGISLRDFPILYTSVTAQHPSGLAAQVWIGIDLGDGDGRQGEIQEIDLDLSHTWASGHSSITLGYVALLFPEGIETTGEIYARWRSGRRWQAGLDLYYNPDLLRDLYASASLRRSWSLPEAWSLATVATVAHAGVEYARFFDGSEGGWHHWSLHLDLTRLLGRQSLTARLGYSRNLDHRVLPDQPIRWWGGVSWAFSRR